MELGHLSNEVHSHLCLVLQGGFHEGSFSGQPPPPRVPAYRGMDRHSLFLCWWEVPLMIGAFNEAKSSRKPNDMMALNLKHTRNGRSLNKTRQAAILSTAEPAGVEVLQVPGSQNCQQKSVLGAGLPQKTWEIESYTKLDILTGPHLICRTLRVWLRRLMKPRNSAQRPIKCSR